MKKLLVAIAALLAVAFAWWWTGPGARARTLDRFPRVVLVTLDTLHLLHTGLFNPDVDGTPELERFAAEGVLFEQARTTVPMTLPAHTSLLSGRTPLGAGVLLNGEKVPDGVRTLPQILGEFGYRTGAFVSLATLRSEYRLDRGFEVYDDGYDAVPRFYRRADEVLAAARPWIEERGEEPYFLWVHLSDPHEPYGLEGGEPDTLVELDGEEVARVRLTDKETQSVDLTLSPGSHTVRWTSLREPAADDHPDTEIWVRFRSNDRLLEYVASWEQLPRPDAGLGGGPLEVELVRTEDLPATLTVSFDGGLRKPPRSEVVDNYQREVDFVDRHLGMLREEVEADDRPVLWILASDHGEGVYRFRSAVGHAGFNREDQLRILWAMKGPGVPAGVRTAARALTHDIAPTVLDVMGIRDLPEAEGESLVRCFDGECERDVTWFAHGFSQKHDKLSAVAAYRWPYKALDQDGSGSGTFNLETDPWERYDLSHKQEGPAPFAARKLQRDIQEVRKLIEGQLAAGARDLSEEDLDLLRSLGYLGN